MLKVVYKRFLFFSPSVLIIFFENNVPTDGEKKRNQKIKIAHLLFYPSCALHLSDN